MLVINRLEHKDDVITQQITRLLAKYFRRIIFVISRVRLENITNDVIQPIITHVGLLGDGLITNEGVLISPIEGLRK